MSKKPTVDAELWSTKPWNRPDAGIPQEIFEPKGMLGDEERRALFWIARNAYSGAGAIIDAGAFVGASAFCLAAGAAQSRHGRLKVPIIYSYDYFIAKDQYVIDYISREFRNIRFNENYLDIFKAQTRPYETTIDARSGDFLEHQWSEGSVEILFIDIAKSLKLNSHVVGQFYPNLIAGKSIVIQQDFYHVWHPWIHITMEYLKDFFEIVDPYCQGQSRIYRNTKPIPPNILQHVVDYDFTVDARRMLLRQASESSETPVNEMLQVIEVYQRGLDGDRAAFEAGLASFGERHPDFHARQDLWAREMVNIEEKTETILAWHSQLADRHPPSRSTATHPPTVENLKTPLNVSELKPMQDGLLVLEGCVIRNPDGTGFGGGSLTVTIVEPRAGDSLRLRQTGDISSIGDRVMFRGREVARRLPGAAGATTLAFQFEPLVYFDALGALFASIELVALGWRATNDRRQVEIHVIDADDDIVEVAVVIETVSMENAQSTKNLDVFLTHIPLLHSWDDGRTWNTGGFGPAELRAMHQFARNCEKPPVILETGAGNSTLAFLLAHPARLISIAPDDFLFARISEYCDQNNINRGALEAVIQLSEIALPRLFLSDPDARVDIALLDGGHGWPTVFVDFCYANALLKKGGILIVDDIHLYSVGEFARFLSDDAARFSLVASFPKTLCFRKETAERFLPDFGAQPYIIAKTNEPSVPRSSPAASRSADPRSESR